MSRRSSMGLAACLGALFAATITCGTSSTLPDVPVEDSGSVGEDADATPQGEVEVLDAHPDTPGFDGSFFHGDWAPVPGVEYCGDMLSKTPAIAAPAFAWKACSSGRAGCRELVVDWTSDPTFGQLLDFAMEPVRLVGGEPFIAYRRDAGEATPSGEWLDIVAPLEGDAVMVMRTHAVDHAGLPCVSGERDVGDYGFVIDGGYNADPPYPPGVGGLFMAWASWSAPSTFRAKTGDNKDFGSGFGLLTTTIGANKIFFGTNEPQHVGILDITTGSLLSPALTTADPTAVPGGAIAVDYTAPYGLMLVGEDGSGVDLWNAATNRTPSAHAVDRSNGNALVWVESNTFDFTNAVLYTSPFATTPGALSPRKVATIPETYHIGGQYLVANAGMALTAMDKDTVKLTRLSDGVGWTIHSEPGWYVVRPLWVDDQEVWIVTNNNTARSEAKSITRIRRDTLGAPDLSPGL